MRACLAIFLGFLGILMVAPGCGPAVAKNELGTIVYDVPKVPGAEKLFPIPDVAPPLEKPGPDL